MTFQEYLKVCKQHRKLNPEWRIGQTYFNVLWIYRRDLAMSVYQTALDPFYNDKIQFVFLDWLEHNWDSEQ